MELTNTTVLIPIPSYGFDPTEVSVPWKILSGEGVQVVFATPTGQPAVADKLVLSGTRFGIFKRTFAARGDAIDAYKDLSKDASFCFPKSYHEAQASDYDAVVLPGGHDKGVKEYLESELLQNLVVNFFDAQKPVGAICHGVVLAARSIHPETSRSVIYNYKTTSLLKLQELFAFNATRLWLKDYFLTYPGTTVEDEVKSVLADKRNFISGPLPLLRDSIKHPERGFVVRDRNYLSARWYGDAYRFSLEFLEMIKETIR